KEAARPGAARAGGRVPQASRAQGLMQLETHAWPSTYGDQAKPRMGFFTDTSVCIGCKACEVACKEWNQIPMEIQGFSGKSYDNTLDLGANRWRHVAFVEQQLDDSSHAQLSEPGRRARVRDVAADAREGDSL